MNSISWYQKLRSPSFEMGNILNLCYKENEFHYIKKLNILMTKMYSWYQEIDFLMSKILFRDINKSNSWYQNLDFRFQELGLNISFACHKWQFAKSELHNYDIETKLDKFVCPLVSNPHQKQNTATSGWGINHEQIILGVFFCYVQNIRNCVVKR